MKFMKDGNELPVGVPLTITKGGEEFHLPPNWLELSTDESRKEFGIKAIDDISGIEEKLKTEKQRRRVAAFTPIQFRRALLKLNLRDAMEMEMEKASLSEKDWWEFSIGFSGADPLLKPIMDRLSKTAYNDLLNIVHGSDDGLPPVIS